MYFIKHDVTVTCSGANQIADSPYINGRLWEISYHPGSTPISTANQFKIFRDTTAYASDLILNKHFPSAATRWVVQSKKCTSSTQPGTVYGTSGALSLGLPWPLADEKIRTAIISSATHANMEVTATFRFYTEPSGTPTTG